MTSVDEKSDYGYTQPLASLLKQATSDAHERVEHSPGAGWLARGELDKDEYIRFLMMLYHIYHTLETALDQHSNHPALAPTYNPTLLARARALSADISFLLNVPNDDSRSWQMHKAHEALLAAPPPAMTAYVTRIADLASSSEDQNGPARLLAHAYVRYLGDLSGGQVIRRRVAKAYGLGIDLDTDGCGDGRGTEFYAFKPLGGTGNATMGDMRKIKDWFREGMNTAGGDDVARKQAIAEEAVRVFELNEGLFSVLRAPSHPSSSSPEVPPLGNPSPTPSPPPPHNKSATRTRTVMHANGDGDGEKTYPLTSILAVVLAVGLAHFALVVGGFTGAKGFAKLEAVQAWLEGLF